MEGFEVAMMVLLSYLVIGVVGSAGLFVGIKLISMAVRFMKYIDAWDPTVESFRGLVAFINWSSFLILFIGVILTILVALWAVICGLCGIPFDH